MRFINSLFLLFLVLMGGQLQAQMEKGEDLSPEELFKQRKEALEQEEKNQPQKKEYGYVRFWNMGSPETPAVALVMKREKAPDSVEIAGGNDSGVHLVNYNYEPGIMTPYKRFPVGDYELGIFKPVVLDDKGVEGITWDKLEPVLKGTRIKLAKNSCLTVILSHQGQFAVRILEDKDEPSYGNRLRILNSVPDVPVEVGYLEDQKEILIWQGKGPVETSKDFGALNKRLPFFLDLTKNGTKIRLLYERDCTFVHLHTLVIFTDRYGRTTYRPFEDGLKAAVSAQ